MTFTRNEIEDFKKSFRKIMECFDENFIWTDLGTSKEFDKCYELFTDFKIEFQKEIRKQEEKLNSLKGKCTVARKTATRKTKRA